MNNFDKTMLATTMMAFAVSMLAISLDAFNIAKMPFPYWTLLLLGSVAGIEMLIFFIIGSYLIFSKKFREDTQKNKSLNLKLIKDDDKINSNLFYKIIFIIAVIFIIFLSIYIIWSNASPNTEISTKYYEFRVLSSSDKGYIHDYKLNYSFNTNQGDLSFSFYGNTQKIDYIIINLPKELNLSNYSLKYEDNKSVNPCYQSLNSPSIRCDNIIGNETIYVSLNVYDQNNSFNPNGIFSFIFPSKDTYAYNYEDTYSYDLLRFDFGNKYRCSEKCYTYDYGNSNFTYNSNKGFFRVYSLPDGQGKIGSSFRFVLNTYNFSKERNSSIWLALGISLLAGCIFFLLDIFKERFEKNRIYLNNKLSYQRDMENKKGSQWFIELQKNRSEYNDVNNCIEFMKFKYDRDLHLPQWLLGIGITVFLSINLSGILKMNESWADVGIAGFIISAILFFIGIIILIVLVNRQNDAMRYLYRERDKQEVQKQKRSYSKNIR